MRFNRISSLFSKMDLFRCDIDVCSDWNQSFMPYFIFLNWSSFFIQIDFITPFQFIYLSYTNVLWEEYIRTNLVINAGWKKSTSSQGWTDREREREGHWLQNNKRNGQQCAWCVCVDVFLFWFLLDIFVWLLWLLLLFVGLCSLCNEDDLMIPSITSQTYRTEKLWLSLRV